MKFQKAYIADSAHLLDPEFTPKAVYLAFDETDTGDVPTPPKAVETDPAAVELEALRARLAVLEAAAKK